MHIRCRILNRLLNNPVLIEEELGRIQAWYEQFRVPQHGVADPSGIISGHANRELSLPNRRSRLTPSSCVGTSTSP